MYFPEWLNVQRLPFGLPCVTRWGELHANFAYACEALHFLHRSSKNIVSGSVDGTAKLLPTRHKKVSCFFAGGGQQATYISSQHLQCPICGKKYTSIGNMRVHMTDAHFSYGPYSCIHCSKVSRTKSGLRMHVLRNHRNSKLCVDSSIMSHPSDLM